MAGLLGQGWDDPQSNAIMQLAGGLLGGNFAQGASAYGNTMAGAKDAAMKRQFLQSQMDENTSQAEARKQQTMLAQRQMAMEQSYFGAGGVPGSSGSTGGAGSPSGHAPGAAGIPAEGKFDEWSKQYGVPKDALIVDYLKNGGKGIAEMLFKRGTPDMQVTNGYAYNKNNLGPGFMPSLSTSTNGQTSMTQVGPDGMPVVSAPRGALETAGAYALQGARVGSMGRVNMRKNADGTESPVPESSENPALFPAPGGGGGSPPALGVLPTSATAPGAWQASHPGQKITTASLSGESDKTRIFTEQLAGAQQRLSLARTPEDENRARSDIAGLQAEMNRSGIRQPAPTVAPLSGPPRYGMSNDQQLAKDAGGKINETWLKTSYEPVIASIGPVNDMLSSVKVARSAIDKMGGTGWGTETKATAANVLAGLGLSSGNSKMMASNAQVFQTAAMDRLQAVLNEAKGPQTEGDSGRAQKTFASLGNTTEANKFILDMAEAKATRDKLKADFYQKALPIAQKKGNLQEIDREWSQRAPSIFSMPSMSAWGIK